GHGDVLPADKGVISEGDFIVAADGGALALERWKVLPHLVVGDMDSLGQAGVERLARQGIAVAKFPANKDESDLELAVTQASGSDSANRAGSATRSSRRPHPSRSSAAWCSFS